MNHDAMIEVIAAHKQGFELAIDAAMKEKL